METQVNTVYFQCHWIVFKHEFKKKVIQNKKNSFQTLGATGLIDSCACNDTNWSTNQCLNMNQFRNNPIRTISLPNAKLLRETRYLWWHNHKLNVVFVYLQNLIWRLHGVWVGEGCVMRLPVSVSLQISPVNPSGQIQMKGFSPTPVTQVPPLWQMFTSQ